MTRKLVETKIGTVSIRIQRNEPNSGDPTGFSVTVRTVGQPDLSITVHASDVVLEDLYGNGHPLPEEVTAHSLTMKTLTARTFAVNFDLDSPE